MDPFMAQLFTTVVGSGSGASMVDAGNHNRGTLSLETVERDETFFPRHEEQLHPGTDMMSNNNNQMHNSSNNNNMTPEVVEEVIGQMTDGFLVSNATHILEMQGGDNDHVSIDMPPHQQVPARLLPVAPMQLSKAIWTISLLTLVFDIRAALYKPARGVVFGHNKIAYYILLSAIFASGLGEATTAFWLSRPGSGSQHRLSIGRAVLCASFLPFITVLSIASYGFKEE